MLFSSEITKVGSQQQKAVLRLPPLFLLSTSLNQLTSYSPCSSILIHFFFSFAFTSFTNQVSVSLSFSSSIHCPPAPVSVPPRPSQIPHTSKSGHGRDTEPPLPMGKKKSQKYIQGHIDDDSRLNLDGGIDMDVLLSTPCLPVSRDRSPSRPNYTWTGDCCGYGSSRSTLI